ncbi:MAG: hypothetical protein C4K58_05830 [Flavobacteriaceae bacterium]|nr:MAG: hypothetical protein C4K58_05830 [Flavobacteriaceae bacterium]
MKPSTSGLLLALLATLLSFGIYFAFLKKDNYFYLDNPSDTLLEVRLNDKIYNLSPKQSLRLNLNKGKHIISVPSQNLDTFFVVTQNQGLVNPLRQTYVNYHRYYGVSQNKDSLITADSIKVDSVYYRGKGVVSNALYLEDFYYGLDQDFEKIVKQDSLKTRSKIFRKRDFIDFYHSL